VKSFKTTGFILDSKRTRRGKVCNASM